jgi:hypothetical protein
MSVPYVGVATTIGPTHMDKLRTMLEEARRAGVRHMQRWWRPVCASLWCFTVVLHCASISVSVQHEDPTQKGCLRNRYACLMELLCRHRYTMFDGSQPFPGSPSISAGVFTWNMTREQVDEFKRTRCDRSTMWLSGGARCWCCDALLAGCLCGRCASGVCDKLLLWWRSGRGCGCGCRCRCSCGCRCECECEWRRQRCARARVSLPRRR